MPQKAFFNSKMREAWLRLKEEAEEEAARVKTVSKIIEIIDSLLDQTGEDPFSYEFNISGVSLEATVSRKKQPALGIGSSLSVTENGRSITVQATIKDETDEFTLFLLDKKATHIEATLGNQQTLRLEPTCENLELFKEASKIMKVGSFT